MDLREMHIDGLLMSMDSEREKFRTYVEKSGVMSALTDALVHLYEESERPSDALQYIKTTLGTMTADNQRMQMFEEKVKEQQITIESQKAKIEALQSEVASLTERLAQAEPQKNADKQPSEEVTQA